MWRDQWAAFDSPASLVLKADFVWRHGFAGLALWDLEGDDFTAAFPLMSTVSALMQLAPTMSPSPTHSLTPSVSPSRSFTSSPNPKPWRRAVLQLQLQFQIPCGAVVAPVDDVHRKYIADRLSAVLPSSAVIKFVSLVVENTTAPAAAQLEAGNNDTITVRRVLLVAPSQDVRLLVGVPVSTPQDVRALTRSVNSSEFQGAARKCLSTAFRTKIEHIALTSSSLLYNYTDAAQPTPFVFAVSYSAAPSTSPSPSGIWNVTDSHPLRDMSAPVQYVLLSGGLGAAILVLFVAYRIRRYHRLHGSRNAVVPVTAATLNNPMVLTHRTRKPWRKKRCHGNSLRRLSGLAEQNTDTEGDRHVSAAVAPISVTEEIDRRQGDGSTARQSSTGASAIEDTGDVSIFDAMCRVEQLFQSTLRLTETQTTSLPAGATYPGSPSLAEGTDSAFVPICDGPDHAAAHSPASTTTVSVDCLLHSVVTGGNIPASE